MYNLLHLDSKIAGLIPPKEEIHEMALAIGQKLEFEFVHQNMRLPA